MGNRNVFHLSAHALMGKSLKSSINIIYIKVSGDFRYTSKTNQPNDNNFKSIARQKLQRLKAKIEDRK